MPSNENHTTPHCPMAVIGMGGVFAKSNNIKEYWRLIFRGVDGIDEVPASHWSPEDYFDPDPTKPDHVYTTRGGYIEPVAFDPTEFGIPPNNLEATDTSQLIGLMAAKSALTDAGYGSDQKPLDRDKVSVVLGVTGTQELVIPLGSRLGHPKWRKALSAIGLPQEKIEEVVCSIADEYVPWQENSFPGLLGNVVAGRIANRLDFGGTNCVVDAACASSMSAINLGLLELESGRSDMVVTGGVDLLNDIFMHMCFAKTRILSATGDIRPFSKDADGTLLGEGVGIVVIKRLADAERDGDRVYAVIKALRSSSDGRSQSIYAPRIEGQMKALNRAYDAAGVPPETVRLLETHGTGTRVGDAVEFEALTKVFGAQTPNGNRCAVGSVKSMIGHTKAAAGVAGLIKTVLAIHHKVIPPTLKAEIPDPELNVEASPFYISTETRPWIGTPHHPRRAGVSAFGFGGSNFHTVLEEYCPEKPEVAWDGSVEIIALSASTPEALLSKAVDTQSILVDAKADRSAVATIAADSRAAFHSDDACRFLAVMDMWNDLTGQIEAITNDLKNNPTDAAWHTDRTAYGVGRPEGKTAFLFPGQGSQYTGMGKDLVCVFPEAMTSVDTMANTLTDPVNFGDCLFPRPAGSPAIQKKNESALRQTDVAQPAIGAVSRAMARVLNRFDIVPDAAAGHSFGELTALWAAGSLSDMDFQALAEARGRLMAAAGKSGDGDPGTMAAVKAPLAMVEPYVNATNGEIVIANRNSPNQWVVSGATPAIKTMIERLEADGIRAVHLPVAAAFHSEKVAGAQTPFQNKLASIKLENPNIAVYANTTGTPYPENSKKASELLGNQMTSPVHFLETVEGLYQDGVRTFVEVGPKTVLSGLTREVLGDRQAQFLAVDKSAGRKNGLLDLAEVLIAWAAQGHPINLTAWEIAAVNSTKRTMAVPLTGANYRTQRTTTKSKTAPPPDTAPRRQSDDRQPPVANPAIAAPATSPLFNQGEEKAEAISAGPRPTGTSPAITPYGHEALKTIQNGLQSIQDIQAQTTRAHQTFLESQAAASRALEEILIQTRHLSGLPPIGHTMPQAVSPQSMAQTPLGGLAPNHAQPPAEHMPVSETAPAEPAECTASAAPIADTLMAVVSDLTGYPAETLAMDMDIEADLGIDSIKRVEILSTLEERMPGLPSVSPDDLGRLATLGQIVAYMTGAMPAAESIAATAVPASASTSVPVAETLMAVVSDLTGYPAETLALDMDIEADLGIDSIKRVEILSTLEERMPGLPSVSPDDLGRLATLGQIVAHFENDSAPSPRPQGDTPGAEIHPSKPGGESVDIMPLERQIPTLVPTEHPGSTAITIAADRPVWITRDGNGLAEALSERLGQGNIASRIIDWDSIDAPMDAVAADPPAGVILLAPNGRHQDPKAAMPILTKAFELAKSAAPALASAASNGHAFMATVTRMDGGFGFSDTGAASPALGGLAGLAKTAGLEWPSVHCLALDVAPDWTDTAAAADAIASELLTPDPTRPTEVGLSAVGRSLIQSISKTASLGSPDVSEDDLIVAVGGGRGVTAEAAVALAKQTRATIALLGRSPEPTPEPAWLMSVTEAGPMKAAILKHEFEGKATPKAIETEFRRIQSNREIQDTLNRIQQNGGTAVYTPVDILDSESLTAALNRLRGAYGPIRGVIHGAGILADRRIVDKTPEQFQRVMATKVAGLSHLLDAVTHDDPAYLVLFSSVSARYGNAGQVDYAMANEVLNKMAGAYQKNHPTCRALAINWGPWDGGMVTPALGREFARRGVSLIPLKLGAEAMISEMSQPSGHAVEVIIGGPTTAMPTEPAIRSQSAEIPVAKLNELLDHAIDGVRYPVLNAHVIGGKPVVPLALITELLAHSALHDNPGLRFHGLDDLRVLKGIRLDSPDVRVRLMAGRTERLSDGFRVPVELHNADIPLASTNGTGRHARATALLTDQMVPPPKAPDMTGILDQPFERSIDSVYRDILFHGEALQGIRRILGCSNQGIVAELSAAPRPQEWIVNPLRSRWIADPLAMDAAFQLATIWCFEQRGIPSLPSYAAEYRQYCDRFPATGTRAVLSVLDAGSNKMRCDIAFLDNNGEVIARINGHEAVMDPSLKQAFKQRIAA